MKKFFVAMSVLLMSAPVCAMLENKKEIIMKFDSINQTFDILKQTPPMECITIDEEKEYRSLLKQDNQIELEHTKVELELIKRLTLEAKQSEKKNRQQCVVMSLIYCGFIACLGFIVLGITIGMVVGNNQRNSTSVNSTASF